MSSNPFDEDEADISPADIADAETDLERRDDLLIAAFLIALAHAFTRGNWAVELDDEIAALDDLSNDANERLLDLLSAGAGFSNYATLLRRIHVQAMGLGRGGFNAITAQDRNRLRSFMRNELGFLSESLGLFNDDGISEVEIQRRLRMYANHVQVSYWDGRTEAKRESGFTEEARVLMPAEHCGECVDLAGMGYQPIGTLPNPGDGSTPCGSNDKCQKIYR